MIRRSACHSLNSVRRDIDQNFADWRTVKFWRSFSCPPPCASASGPLVFLFPCVFFVGVRFPGLVRFIVDLVTLSPSATADAQLSLTALVRSRHMETNRAPAP